MKELAYAIGIVVGGIAVLTICIVWYRHRVFGAGGMIQSIVGVMLIGMSVWGNVKIILPGGGGVELENDKKAIRREINQARDKM